MSQPSGSSAGGAGGTGTRAWSLAWIWDLHSLLQWSGSCMLPSKCWVLCVAFQVSQTASQIQRKLLVIKVFGHIFLREHSKCMTQLRCCLKNQCSCPNFPTTCWVGMPLCSPAESKFLSHMLHFFHKHNEFKLIFSFWYTNNTAPRSELSFKQNAKPWNIVRLKIKVRIAW